MVRDFSVKPFGKTGIFAGLFSVECSKSKDVETERENQFIGGSKGGARDARPPWGSKFFHFHAVFGKKIAK